MNTKVFNMTQEILEYKQKELAHYSEEKQSKDKNL